REQLAEAVPEAADAHRRENPGRDADQERQAHRDEGQQQRVRQALQIELEDRRLVIERLAEIAVSETPHKQPVLHPERPVETELSWTSCCILSRIAARFL